MHLQVADSHYNGIKGEINLDFLRKFSHISHVLAGIGEEVATAGSDTIPPGASSQC